MFDIIDARCNHEVREVSSSYSLNSLSKIVFMVMCVSGSAWRPFYIPYDPQTTSMKFNSSHNVKGPFAVKVIKTQLAPTWRNEGWIFKYEGSIVLRHFEAFLLLTT